MKIIESSGDLYPQLKSNKIPLDARLEQGRVQAHADDDDDDDDVGDGVLPGADDADGPRTAAAQSDLEALSLRIEKKTTFKWIDTGFTACSESCLGGTLTARLPTNNMAG
jgi:hypothetical protein